MFDNDSLPLGPTCLLPDFTAWYTYKNHHFYIAAVVSVSGLIGHAVLIGILTSKTLFNPTNQLLTCLSAMQSLLLLSYVCFNTWHRLAEVHCARHFWSLPWVIVALVTHALQIFAQTAAQWLIVVICVQRCVCTTQAFARRQLYGFTHRAATICLVVVLMISFVVCLPVSLWATVVPDTNGATRLHCAPEILALTEADSLASQQSRWQQALQGAYKIGYTRLGLNQSFMKTANLLFLIGGKLVPLLMITAVTAKLLCQLKAIQRRAIMVRISSAERRLNSMQQQQCPASVTPAAAADAPSISLLAPADKQRSNSLLPPHFTGYLRKQSSSTDSGVVNRRRSARPYKLTTNLVMVIMGLFIVFEAPQTLVLLYVEFVGDGFMSVVSCYRNIVELFELCSILYSSINFALFCASSTQFRQTFLQLMSCRQLLAGKRLRNSFNTALRQSDKSFLSLGRAHSTFSDTASAARADSLRAGSCRIQFRYVISDDDRGPQPPPLTPAVKTRQVKLIDEKADGSTEVLEVWFSTNKMVSPSTSTVLHCNNTDIML